MESVNDRDTMEDMITFGQWSLQTYYFCLTWLIAFSTNFALLFCLYTLDDSHPKDSATL